MLRKVDTGLEAEKDRFRTYYSEKLCGDYVGLEPIRKNICGSLGYGWRLDLLRQDCIMPAVSCGMFRRR